MSQGRPRKKPAKAPKKKRGPKMALTAELANNLVSLLQNGITVAVACEATGISVPTYYRWLDMSKSSKENSLLKKFEKGVLSARALGEINLVKVLQDSATKDPRWAAWLLERMHGERYGQQEKVTVTGALQHSHAHQIVVNMPPMMSQPRLPMPPRTIEAPDPQAAQDSAK